MHDAYEATAILKLTVQIESIAAYGKYITSIFALAVLKRLFIYKESPRFTKQKIYNAT